MATFDIVTAAGNGYTKVWEERHYLIGLALVPIIIKFACFVTMISMDVDDNHLRAALIMLPAYFAEGWMLAHWVRLITLGQRWPFRPTGDDDKDMAALNDRARGVLSGMIIFVLIQMIITALWAWVTTLPVDEEALKAPTMEMRLMSVAVFVFMLWGFRFLWFFIPAAANYSIKEFMKDIGHPKLSLYMIAVWLVCVVPGFALMMGFTLPLLLSEGEDIPTAVQFGSAGVHVVLEAVINLLATAGIAYGLKDMYSSRNGKTS
ncbi:MAG: hypothetical protein AAF569_08120 [Pseudomonadota bacterium]